MLKVFFRFFTPMILLLVLMFYIIGSVKSKHNIQEAILRGEAEIAIRKNSILNILTPLVANNKYIGSSSMFKSNLSDTLVKKQILNDLILFTRGHSFFEQVQGFDTLGQEAFRLNNYSDSIQFVPKEKLQNKSLTDYFETPISLKSNEMYISPMELHREHDTIDKPYRVVARIMSPVTEDAQGKTLGFFVTNISVQNLVSAFSREVTTDSLSLLMLNYKDEGVYTKEHKVRLMYDELNEGFTLQDTLPELWTKMQESVSGQLIYPNGVFVYDQFNLADELSKMSSLSDVTFIHPEHAVINLVTFIPLKSTGILGGFIWSAKVLMLFLVVLFVVLALILTKRKMNELRMFEEITVLNKKLYADQQKLEESVAQLSRRNTQLKEFSQIISHNIRSPLAGLTLLIDFLREDEMSLSEEEKKEVVEKLIFSAKTLNSLTDDLFETVNVLEKGDLVIEELDLLKALDKSKDVLTTQILEANASIEVNTEAWRYIKYNRQYLESIIFNLLNNALKYRDEDRSLVVGIYTEMIDGRKVLKVSDNGRGINMEWHRENVFGLHETFHRGASGKGLGLFMTKTQIQTMGGEIHVESEVGKGSTFIIIF